MIVLDMRIIIVFSRVVSNFNKKSPILQVLVFSYLGNSIYLKLKLLDLYFVSKVYNRSVKYGEMGLKFGR